MQLLIKAGIFLVANGIVLCVLNFTIRPIIMYALDVPKLDTQLTILFWAGMIIMWGHFGAVELERIINSILHREDERSDIADAIDRFLYRNDP